MFFYLYVQSPSLFYQKLLVQFFEYFSFPGHINCFLLFLGEMLEQIRDCWL